MQAVPDASFIVWSIASDDPGERNRRIALQTFFWRFSPVAPAHLVFEVGNAIRKAWLQITPAERPELQDSLLNGVQLEPVVFASFPEIHRLADKHGLSYYDAAYLQLAKAKDDRVLLTQDAKLRRAAIAELGTARALDSAGAQRIQRETEEDQ